MSVDGDESVQLSGISGPDEEGGVGVEVCGVEKAVSEVSLIDSWGWRGRMREEEGGGRRRMVQG